MIEIPWRRVLAVTCAVAALALPAPVTSQGELARRVMDINPTVSTAGSAPGYGWGMSAQLGAYVYFVATTDSSGEELWRTDGTAAGTQMVKDILPGNSPFGSFPEQLTPSGSLLYFTASDRVTGGLIGPELFVTDGTAAGTHIVKDIRPGQYGSAPEKLTDVNGTLYFIADDGVTGYELWKTDGSEAGTVLVKEIIPGPAPFDPYDAALELTNLNGTLFFSACDAGAINCELWKSDGTAAGTVRVKDINPGVESSYPFNLTALNGLIYFTARDPQGGSELWSSDGTESGTRRVKDINLGPGSSYPGSFSAGAGRLYFLATGESTGSEIWRTDGTEEGTEVMTDMNPVGADNVLLGDVTAVGDVVFFTSIDFVSFQATGLWRTDGTAAGTSRVHTSFVAGPLTPVNGTLYFQEEMSPFGNELWKSDGTLAGTVMVKDISPGESWGLESHSMSPFVHLNGTLIFHANDGVAGSELWRSDGTEAGTQLVADLNIRAGSSNPSWVVAVDKDAFFSADDGTSGEELWVTKGVEASTYRVKDIVAGSRGSQPQSLVNSNGVLFFNARIPERYTSREIWKSDGTDLGTVRVKSGVRTSGPLVALNGRVFFAGSATGSTMELWKSDGSAAGTVGVKDMWPGTARGPLLSLTVVNGSLYFIADDGVHGLELWKSDGTEPGTVMLKDIRPGPVGSRSLYDASLTDVGGVLFFEADDGTNGVELWRSDGTAEGTVMVKDIFAGPGSSAPSWITGLNGTAFFVATHADTGRELWKSDGTGAGTVRVANLRPLWLTAVREALFFMAARRQSGVELWTSDGTEAGTRLVRDIDPGLSSSQPEDEDVAIVGAGFGKCLFAASDGTHGLELWRSDGTALGTLLVADIAPGPLSSSPRNFAVAGPRVFFSADDNRTGRELYEMPAFAVQLPSPALKSLSKRFQGLGRRRHMPPQVLESAAWVWPDIER